MTRQAITDTGGRLSPEQTKRWSPSVAGPPGRPQASVPASSCPWNTSLISHDRKRTYLSAVRTPSVLVPTEKGEGGDGGAAGGWVLTQAVTRGCPPGWEQRAIRKSCQVMRAESDLALMEQNMAWGSLGHEGRRQHCRLTQPGEASEARASRRKRKGPKPH